MYMYNEKIGNKLNELLEKNYDAEAGYKKAAENAKSESLSLFFNRKSEERRTFGHEIKNELLKFNQKPEKGTSIAGDAHRTWMDVKSFFSLDTDEAMLEAAMVGEKNALNEYKEILNEKDVYFPQATNSLLHNQYAKINSDLQTIHELKDIK